MPGSDVKEAAVLIADILEELAQTPMRLDSIKITVTASVGLVAVEDDESWGSAYIACDEALYEAENRWTKSLRDQHPNTSARLYTKLNQAKFLMPLPSPRRKRITVATGIRARIPDQSYGG